MGFAVTYALWFVFLRTPRVAPRQYHVRLHSFDGRSQQVYERAYATLVSSSEYIIGAEILICRLRSYSADIPIIMLLDASIGPLWEDPFYKAMHVDILVVENPVPPHVAQEIRVGTYTKLNVWNLEKTAKTLVYLDADTIPVQDPVSLFDALQTNTTPKWDFYAHGNKAYFNSGVMVLRPSSATFHALVQRLFSNNYQKNAQNPTEQDLLITHFASSATARWEAHPFMNFRPMHHGSLAKTAVVVHWAGNPKPWSLMLGHATSVHGQKVDSNHMPAWSQKLFACEWERYLRSCSNIETSQFANFSCAAIFP